MSLTLIIPKRHILISPHEYSQEFLSGCVLRLPLWGYQHRMVGSRFADYLVYGNHGTPFGGYWEKQGQTRVRGFDGIDDYMDCGHDESLNITDALTLEAWVLATGFLANDNSHILRKEGSYGMWVEKSTACPWGRIWQSDGAEISIPKNKSINLNEWSHLGIIANPDTFLVEMFTNRELNSQTNYDGTIYASGAHLFISYYKDNPPEHWKGFIAEARIYNRGKSPEENRAQFLYDIQHLPFLVGANYLRR